MPNGVEIFKRYPNNYFIETGSHIGEGIQMAIETGYKNIISVELSDHFLKHCQDRFKNYSHVKLVHGDSSEILWPTIKDINEPITFWLDGHYSCEDTALGKFWSPLMEELKQIKKHHIKTHTILMDDMRCWSADNPVIGFGKDEIMSLVLSINENYKFSYVDGHAPNDVLIAKVP